MKTCKEMAKLWGVTERTVTTFCKTGKIPGAVKEGKSWRIPDEAEKPVDGRILSGKYVKKEEKEAKEEDTFSENSSDITTHYGEVQSFGNNRIGQNFRFFCGQ